MLEVVELILNFSDWSLIIVAGGQLNTFDGARLDCRLAEANKILNLVRNPKIGFFNRDGLSPLKIRAKNRVITVAGVAVVNGEVLLFKNGWLS